ncbi:hypothetical protein [Devosia sp.]|uniref:hypothetical protein n=1 Tax=Devosia sp. TaxID=1871048 RepID=UPI001AD50801|nr:hypothetical protein [Devosia sp.]MBN9334709.1 hypothetical protein [Devosia sp.]
MTVRPFVANPILTAIAVGYRNTAISLIADRVLPRVDVYLENFKWTEFPLAESFTVPDTEVGRRGQPNVLEFTGTERTGSVKDHGLDTETVDGADQRISAAGRNLDRAIGGRMLGDQEAGDGGCSGPGCQRLCGWPQDHLGR